MLFYFFLVAFNSLLILQSIKHQTAEKITMANSKKGFFYTSS